MCPCTTQTSDLAVLDAAYTIADDLNWGSDSLEDTSVAVKRDRPWPEVLGTTLGALRRFKVKPWRPDPTPGVILESTLGRSLMLAADECLFRGTFLAMAVAEIRSKNLMQVWRVRCGE